MLRRGLSWRMGFMYLRRQQRQTLLSILAGALGAMLISMSIFHYAAVKESGDRWVSSHFGPIDWVLVPHQGMLFDSKQASDLMSEIDSLMPYRILPAVSGSTTLFASAHEDASSKSLQQVQLLGVDPLRAAVFDADQESLWNKGLPSGQAIVDQDTASRLGLESGDALWAADTDGTRKPYLIRQVVEATGLTGYRGEQGTRNGTLILNEEDAAALAGDAAGSYSSVMIGRKDPADSVMGMNRSPGMDALTETRFVKSDALSQARGETVFLILAISMTAIFSSAFLLRQIVHMMAESRTELYGVLRAIGLNRRQIRGLFAAEALLLGLLSGLVGLLAGAAGGWAMVRLLYGGGYNSAVSMTGIPVHAVISPGIAAAGVGGVLLYQCLLVLLASRRAGAGPIVAALRGGAFSSAQGERRRGRRFADYLLPILAAMIIGVHLYHAFLWEPGVASGINMLILLLVWLAASAAVIYLVFRLLLSIGRRLAGGMSLSSLLAVRYAGKRPSRTFTVMLLFGITMMTVTFASGIGSQILKGMDVEGKAQTMLGYAGYVPYQSQAEKERVLELLSKDEVLSRSITGHADVQPLMIAPQLKVEDSRFGQAIVPVTQELVSGGGWSLAARAPEFSSDKEAWDKVMSDSGYIILPLQYQLSGQTSAYWNKADYAAGDMITMGLFKKEYVSSSDKPDLTLKLKIAGFAAENTESGARTRYVFATTYGSPKLLEQLKPYHHPWSNQNHQGLLLLQFDYRDLQLDRDISSRLVSGGASSAGIPYLSSTEQFGESRAMLNGFIGFMILSAIIGLIGLGVLQKRSIGERSREIAMLRCAGIPSRQLFRAFLLEGTLLGGCGLLAGTAAGSSGAHAFIRILAQSDARPGEAPIEVAFPWLLLTLVLAGLLATAFLFNIGPARSAMLASPTEPLRSTDV